MSPKDDKRPTDELPEGDTSSLGGGADSSNRPWEIEPPGGDIIRPPCPEEGQQPEADAADPEASG